MTDQIDTSNPEGFQKVVMHACKNGMQSIQVATDTNSEYHTPCASNVERMLVNLNNRNDLTYRIKPEHKPVSGDIYQDNDNDEVWLVDKDDDGWNVIVYDNDDKHFVATDIKEKDLKKLIRHVDFPTLQDGELA